MYRILVADDEGIMLEAFKSVIAGAFGEECVVETAKTGRAVTEIAETFHPDVVFMDIHMPGINGIQAMREIRKFNTTALFYVVSAYDKFDYAKEAIDLGVERYLTKPIPRAKIIAAVEEAIGKVDAKRNQRSNLLKIQENWRRSFRLWRAVLSEVCFFSRKCRRQIITSSFWTLKTVRDMS